MDMTEIAIGFAEKYYTLWYVDTYTRTIREGQDEIVTRYTYVKNISFDRKRAFAQYPNARFIEDLRGKTRSWDSVKVVWTNVNTFRFGKYNGQSIDNCTDTNYIVWYWGEVYGEHKDYVSGVLESRGYEIRISESEYVDYDGNVKKQTYYSALSPTDLENERIAEQKADEFKTMLDSGNPFNLFVEYNPNEEGLYKYEDVLYKFAEVGENYYNGYTYYLPMLKGKQKRVKGKTISVKKYDYTEDERNIIVNIYDFAVNK